MEERVEVVGREGKRNKQLLDDLKEMRGYWKFTNEALDCTLRRTRIGIDYGPAQERLRNERTYACKIYLYIAKSLWFKTGIPEIEIQLTTEKRDFSIPRSRLAVANILMRSSI
jgi:hypothetical protein